MKNIAAVILAAGEGTRMKSSLPTPAPSASSSCPRRGSRDRASASSARPERCTTAFRRARGSSGPATGAPASEHQIDTRWVLPEPGGPERSTIRFGQSGQVSINARAARLAAPTRKSARSWAGLCANGNASWRLRFTSWPFIGVSPARLARCPARRDRKPKSGPRVTPAQCGAPN